MRRMAGSLVGVCLLAALHPAVGLFVQVRPASAAPGEGCATAFVSNFNSNTVSTVTVPCAVGGGNHAVTVATASGQSAVAPVTLAIGACVVAVVADPRLTG